jgi:hypothetical protein
VRAASGGRLDCSLAKSVVLEHPLLDDARPEPKKEVIEEHAHHSMPEDERQK